MRMNPLPLKNSIRPVILGVGLAMLPSFQAGAATLVLDWLKLAPGGGTSNFTLRNDGASTAAAGRVVVSSGVIFPGPVQRDLASASWNSAPDFIDSVTGTTLVPAFDIRVAPATGPTNYSVEFQLNPGVEHYLMVGGLFKNPSSSTAGATISALSDSGSFALSFDGAMGWSNGVEILSQDVTWDPLARTLAPVAGANGETKPAFFHVDAMSGANPRIRIDIPIGYALADGDALLFAVATVVPEPSQAYLLVVGTGLLMCRRRRP